MEFTGGGWVLLVVPVEMGRTTGPWPMGWEAAKGLSRAEELVDGGKMERFFWYDSTYEFMESMWSRRRRRSSESASGLCWEGVGKVEGLETGTARVMVAGSRKA